MAMKNSLSEIYPEIAAEWHYQNNGDLLPSDIAPKSHKKVWWRCAKCGHEWMAIVSNRTGRNTGCPKCKIENARKRAKEKVNSENSFENWCMHNEERGKQLLHEWDYDKNREVLPSTVTYGSTQKVFWKCEKGHSWRSTINGRTMGRDCPVCSNRIIVPGENDLNSRFPEISAEWNYNKNKNILPTKISYGSEKKVWWICSKGHEWQSTPNSRTSNNTGCPVCAHYQIDPKETSLAATYPELIKEWDSKKNKYAPDQVFPTSKMYAWWKCSICGFSWKTMVGTRTKGTGCPNCTKRNRTSFPEQAIYYYVKKQHSDAELHYKRIFDNGMELDIYIPSKRIGIEYDGEAWHSSSASKKRAQIKYQLCRQNKIKLIRIKEKEAQDYDDCDILIHSDYDRNKISTIDNVLDTLGKYITLPSHDCSRDEITIKTQYLSSLPKEAIRLDKAPFINEWDYEKNGELKPTMFTTASAQIIWWRCKNNHSWRSAIYSRTQGHGCPYCINQKVWPGFNDLKTKNGELAKEWNTIKNKPLNPSEIVYSSNKKVWWICAKCGYEWQASLYNRMIKGTGCPVCSNNVVKAGVNDLASTNPELLKEWNYNKNIDCSPQMFVAGSTKKVWWICSKGHEWKTQINVRSRGCGCPKCNRKRNIEAD